MVRLGWLTSTLVLGSCAGDIAPLADASDPCSMCAALIAEFEDGLRKEQACDPSAPDQCLKQAAFFCGCPVWVTTTSLTDAARERYLAAGCLRCGINMPCVAKCVQPGTGVCVPVMAAAQPPGVAAPVVALPPKGQCMRQF
jgi:hypothetical protein